MAQIKISELNSATNLNNNDVFPIVNSGDTKKATLSQLKTFVGGLDDYYTKDEMDAITGDLDELDTEEKSDLVSAINEVNGNIQTTQYNTMPTASSATVGQIVQYVGETDATYTNGYFYIGTTDGDNPATYGWNQLNVQDASGGSTTIVLSGSYNVTTLSSLNTNISQADGDKIAAFIKETGWTYGDGLEKIADISFYIPNSAGAKITPYQVDATTGTVSDVSYYVFRYKCFCPAPSTSRLDGNAADMKINIIFMQLYIRQDTLAFVSLNGLTYITAKQMMGYLSKTNTESYTPTQEYHPATKGYVDSSISDKIWVGTQDEYDALSTYNENTIYFIKEDADVSA